jgi:CRP-like cAMP-binding protein/cytochrome P450
LPLIGNARELLSDPGRLMVEGHRRFGAVFRLRILWKSMTVIAGEGAKTFMADHLDEAYLTRHPVFDSIEREFGPGDFVMAHTGDRHTRLRAPLAVSYSRQVASPFVPQLTDVARETARAWPVGGRVTVIDSTSHLAFDQWCRLLGPGASRLAFDDCRRLSAYWMMVGATVLPPWIFRVPWYRSAHRRTFATFRDLVREARQAGPPAGKPPTIVDTLVSAADSSGVPLTDDEAVTYIAYGTLGACAYVARLTAFMLYEILRDPALMEELGGEVRQAFHAGVREASDLRRMRVLQSVYQETLRRHPVSPGMPFVVDHDFEYEGARFRKGEATVVSPVPLSFSPATFRDPDRFDATRCRDPRNEHRKGNCHPFGLGNRTCVAGGLVEVMALTLIASVLDERQMVMDPRGYTLEITARPLPAPNRRLGIRAGGTPHVTARDAPLGALEEDRLAAFAGHDEPATIAAIARAEARRFPPGAVIIREGDPSDAYYLLQSGAAVVTRGDPPVHVADLGPGEGFGELGLLQHAARSATVTAGVGGADTLVLGREAFLAMVASSDLVATEIRALMHKRVASNRLRQVASGLTAAAAAQALADFTWERYGAGEVVLREGDPADHFFVLIEGEVEVSRAGPGGATVVAVLGAGEYFGEVGLLHGAPRNATVSATRGGPVVVLRTDAAGFDRLLNQTGEAGAELARAMLACAERLAVR